MVRLLSRLKHPCSAIAREAFGPRSAKYKRIKAIEQWALNHGYNGYKSINRRTKEDKALQTSIKI